ncbi:MAG: hypothetical protein V7459_03370 [Oceanicoccus sp.]
MTVYTLIDCQGKNPEPLLLERCDALVAGASEFVVIRYMFDQYWLEDSPSIPLLAFYHLERGSDAVKIHFAVTESSRAEAVLADPLPEDLWDAMQYAAGKLCLPVFSSDQPIPLVSANIAKPWGQEIWFTGIEQRGVAGAGNKDKKSSLPYVLSALPDQLCCGRQRDLILLKILDPLPEEIFGDLYFELHQEKREVYVVTHVDSDAWPSGEGAIRFGFCPEKRQRFDSDEQFRQGFLNAVKNYEATRRKIDLLTDRQRLIDNVGVNEPVDAAQLKMWLQSVPQQLVNEERVKRQEMESFTDSLPLRVGDVVKVPCLTPHSLQHGVRTVEFQTPVYERLILSFAQKVLTQQHWNTEEAVKLMALEKQMPDAHTQVLGEPGVDIQRIVDFEDFEVRRVSLNPGVSMEIGAPDTYGILMAIDHGIVANASDVEPENAILIPGSCDALVLTNSSPKTGSFLLAFPK